jgi:hypothetical protein
MESYTYMSDEGINAMMRNQRNNGEAYTFTLGAREYNLFRKALDIVAISHPNENLRNWAEYFTNSMASPEFSIHGEAFENVVYSLRFVWFNAALVENDHPELAEWAGDFLSSMALTLDVEFI